MKRSHRFVVPAVTLTEVLVTVAVIALLLAILLPGLSRAKDPTRRTLCADNMRVLMESVFSYASDHQGKGPIRGWFPYDIAESSHEAYGWGGNTKVPINLGMLHKKWTGGEHDRLYCPATYTTIRDNPSHGWKTTFNPMAPFTPGSYNYAVVFGPRLLASPMFEGTDPFPRGLWSSKFTDWVEKWELTWNKTFMMPHSPALAFDISLVPTHKTGFNVMYMDGHVRYHNDAGAASSTSTGSYELWYKVSLKQ